MRERVEFALNGGVFKKKMDLCITFCKEKKEFYDCVLNFGS